MKVYQDRGIVSGLAAGLLIVTGGPILVSGTTGSESGWGLRVGAGMAVAAGVLVLARIENTTTSVDEIGRVLTIERRHLLGRGKCEEIPLAAIESVVARHIGLDEEYSEHGLILLLTNGSRRRLANYMRPDRIDAVRDAIRASLER